MRARTKLNNCSIKRTLDINVLHNLHSHFIVQDFSSLLNAIYDRNSLTLGGSSITRAKGQSPSYCTVWTS